jgi:hypothetical protein
MLSRPRALRRELHPAEETLERKKLAEMPARAAKAPPAAVVQRRLKDEPGGLGQKEAHFPVRVWQLNDSRVRLFKKNVVCGRALYRLFGSAFVV